MAIRGRRYPAASRINPIIIRRPYPPPYRRYIRPTVTVFLPKIYRAPNRATPAAPQPPIATPMRYTRLAQPSPAPTRNRTQQPRAMFQASSRVVASQQARPARTTQNTVRHVTIVNPTPPQSPARARPPVVNRPQIVTPQTNRHNFPVRVVNPPTPAVQHNRFDSQKFRHRQPQFPYPNRRQP